MTTEAIQRLAQQIADGLFTDGSGREATRLRMEYTNGWQDVGIGWSKAAARDRIADALRAELVRDGEGVAT